MKAQAAIMYAVNEPLRIEEILLDEPARGEVLIRTAFAGVCHSDLHYIEGLYTRRARVFWATNRPVSWRRSART